jgi:hypothetical protein
LSIDLRPFRQSLLNEAGLWGSLLRHHLENYVINRWDFLTGGKIMLILIFSLSSLSTFIVEAETGLAAAVKDNDYQSLVNVMSYLRQVNYYCPI